MRFKPNSTLVPSESHRKRLKRPLGHLIRGAPEETREELSKLLRKVDGWIITVGDMVSRELRDIGLEAKVYIVDGKIERREGEELRIDDAREIRCRNDPGVISLEAYEAVARAINSEGKFLVRVEGEEDLLGLVAIAEAPSGSVVLYGQPGEGVVVVSVTEGKRGEALAILKSSAS